MPSDLPATSADVVLSAHALLAALPRSPEHDSALEAHIRLVCSHVLELLPMLGAVDSDG